MIGDVDGKTGEAYFIVVGEPYVTIKFPWTELVIVVVMMLIAIRLLFKKQTDSIVREGVHEVEKGVYYFKK